MHQSTGVYWTIGNDKLDEPAILFVMIALLGRSRMRATAMESRDVA